MGCLMCNVGRYGHVGPMWSRIMPQRLNVEVDQLGVHGVIDGQNLHRLWVWADFQMLLYEELASTAK